MKVIFSHGKESGPWGSKIKALAAIAKDCGCSVDSLDYQGVIDPDERVAQLQRYLAVENDSFVLVGSSMGGYVALVAAMEYPPEALFLLAPALSIPGYQQQTYQTTCPVEIVHGWSDDVIPVENSIAFAKSSQACAHLIRGDHRLNSSLDEVTRLFRSFLHATRAAAAE